MDDKTKNPFADIFSIPNTIECNNSIESLINNEDNEKKDIPKKFNYDKKRNKFYDKAKSTIDSLLKFYLTSDLISEDDYIKQKAYHDQCTLGDLMNQIEIANRAITTLMENIDLGDMPPRMFEVLAGMQHSIIDLLKMKSMHILSMESELKKIVSEREMFNQKSIGNGNKINQDGGITSRGSKKLMQQIQEAIRNENIEDANID